VRKTTVAALSQEGRTVTTRSDTGDSRQSHGQGAAPRRLRKRLLEWLATTVNSRFLSARSWRTHLWRKARFFMVSFMADPACEVTVHGRRLWLPLSHALPIYLRDCQLYDDLPRRLARFVRGRYGPLCAIDVGANVGDSIAAFRPEPQDRFLAIEPSSKFATCLKRNFGPPQVEILEKALSDQPMQSGLKIVERSGTASVISGDSEHSQMGAHTLDDLIASKKEFEALNILKVDTDGNDFAVIRGAKETIGRFRPVVMLECDLFDNGAYVDDVLEVIALLEECGLDSMLAYDNFGFLMSSYSSANATPFLDLLYYQLISPFYYFDLVFMKREDALAFLAEEHLFFAGRLSGAAALAAGRAREQRESACFGVEHRARRRSD